MSNLEKFESLFPLQGKITQLILSTANRSDSRNCVGALTLKAALGENIKLVTDPSLWGVVDGKIIIGDEYTFVTTSENIDMMDVEEPQDVTFVLV